MKNIIIAVSLLGTVTVASAQNTPAKAAPPAKPATPPATPPAAGAPTTPAPPMTPATPTTPAAPPTTGVPATPTPPGTPPTAGAPATSTTPGTPPPPATPTAPGTPPTAGTPATPADPATPAAPAEPAKPAPTFTDTTPSAGSAIGTTIVDEGGSSVSSSSDAPEKDNPSIALELSGAGAYVANTYVEYKGYALEHGAPMGMRLEVNLKGISLAYELATMVNDQACGVGCVQGDFGSTKFHVFDLGYRFRFAQIGPVRPFVAASLGGVLANSGDWSMTTNKTVYGGQGRAGFGVEIPIAGRFFASATLAYKILVTENPLRDKDAERANTLLVGNGGSIPNGDYAEDLHLVSGYVGFGAEL